MAKGTMMLGEITGVTWKQVISICLLIVGMTGCVPIPYYAGAGEVVSVDLDVGKIAPLEPDEAVLFFSGSSWKPDDKAVECIKTATRDAVKKFISNERIKYKVFIDTRKRALEKTGTKTDAGVALFSSGDEEMTMVATIVEAGFTNKLGTVTIVVREDTAAGFIGARGMPPVGVMVFGITGMTDTACKEMANQLIKIFGGGEGS